MVITVTPRLLESCPIQNTPVAHFGPGPETLPFLLHHLYNISLKRGFMEVCKYRYFRYRYFSGTTIQLFHTLDFLVVGFLRRQSSFGGHGKEHTDIVIVMKGGTGREPIKFTRITIGQ